MYKKEEEDNSIKVEPAHVIEIYNGEKNLTIDFEGDTVEVSGTLEVSEAAKIFIDSISLYFHDKFIEKEKVKEAIRDLYSDVRGMQVNTDIGFTLCPIETLQRIKKLYRELTIGEVEVDPEVVWPTTRAL